MSMTAFVLAYALIAVTPGPNFLIVLHSAMTGARTAALWTAAGVGAGAASLACLVLLVGQHLPLHDSAQPYLRLVFAALLIRGGLVCFRFRPALILSGVVAPPKRASEGFLRGMAVAISNPFTGLFVLSTSSTLVDATEPAVILSIVLTIFVIATGWLGLVAVAATGGPAGRLISARSQGVSACVGLLLIAMGVQVVAGAWAG